MPLGIQRLNATTPQPSSNITFIKPLPGPDSFYAQDFLERIAAICHPIMQDNHLSITTLEEYEPNREFLGRNFNAGEVIQLVLKSSQHQRWLSFRAVQMVMIHELAHCKQMNHGRGFWTVNGQFKGQLRELWSRNYTGDGLWGRGQTLLSGRYDSSGRTNLEHDSIPARSLCGGTFGSRRRRKRRRVANSAAGGGGETAAEAKQRRIAKKFGVNGATLGGNETTRVKLEYGAKVKGNPRVANSARGRELRVAAAAARFGMQQQQQKPNDGADKEKKKGGDVNLVSSDESKSEIQTEKGDDDDEYEYEYEYEEIEEGQELAHHGGPALNPNGSQILDRNGQSMVRICSAKDEGQDHRNDNEDSSSRHIKEEMDELQELNEYSAVRKGSTVIDEQSSQLEGRQAAASSSPKPHKNNADSSIMDPTKTLKHLSCSALPTPGPSTINQTTVPNSTTPHSSSTHSPSPNPTAAPPTTTTTTTTISDASSPCPQSKATSPTSSTSPNNLTCPSCSLSINPSSSSPLSLPPILCIACSHVLDTTRATPGFWHCTSKACSESSSSREYVNAAECGMCGICGVRKGG